MGTPPSVRSEPFGQTAPCRWLPGRLGNQVQPLQAALHEANAQPPQRFRLPWSKTVPGHREFGEITRPSSDEIGQNTPRQIGSRDPLPGVAAGKRDPRTGIVAHRRHPVARNAQRPTPGMREPDTVETQHREPFVAHPPQHLVRRIVPVERISNPRTEPVRRATPAEHDATIGSPLEVVHRQALRRKKFAILPADLSPDRLGQRFGTG